MQRKLFTKLEEYQPHSLSHRTTSRLSSRTHPIKLSLVLSRTRNQKDQHFYSHSRSYA